MHDAIVEETRGVAVYDSFPVDADDPTGSVLTGITAGQSMYHFSQYGLYEYPFSWLVKCSILTGHVPSDAAVPCDEWTQSFDAADAATSGLDRDKPLSTWNFLTRVRGGLLSLDDPEVIAANLESWNNMVDRVDTSIFGQFFDAYEGGDLRRTCATRRELIQQYVDDSRGLRGYIYESLTQPEAAPGVRRWIPLSVYYTNDEGQNICRGVSTCGEGVCGCTRVAGTTQEPAKTITPATLALQYVRETGELQISRNNFMAPLSLNRNLELSVVKFSMLDLDAGGWLQVITNHLR